MKITVKELIEKLKAHEGHLEIDFQGLEFLRLKQRSPTVIQVEFVQIVDFDPACETWSAHTPK
jgi:hypothetical protein